MSHGEQEAEPAFSRDTEPPLIVPPWQLWRADSLGNTEVARAEDLVRQGNLDQAVQVYREVERTAADEGLRKEVFLRRMGTMLRLGRSKEILHDVTRFLQERNKSISDVGMRLSIVVAYAYYHQRDWDQTLAWLRQAHEQSAAKESGRRLVSKRTARLIRSLSDEEFGALSERWSVDSFCGPLFKAERLRRARGGRPIAVSTLDWFSAATYGREEARPLVGQPFLADATTELPPAAAAQTGQFVIGVLLPLSGQYAEHAQRVLRGIELGIENSPFAGSIALEVGDSAGSEFTAEEEYTRLVEEKGASVVFGPLLVKTTERVAEASRRLGVPIVSFAKRQGLPELGPTVFRLGATAQNQASELADYAVSELALLRLAVLYPNTSSGMEFVEVFRREAQSRRADIILEASYSADDLSSVTAVMERVRAASPAAVFVPDSLEGALSLLKELEESEVKEAVLLGPAYWNDPLAVRGYSTLLEGAVFVTPFFERSSDPVVLEFSEAYRLKYQEEPELLAAQAYDAVRYVLEAVGSVPLPRGEVLNRMRSAGIWSGVTGNLSVNEEGDILRRMSVLRIQNGDVVEVMFRGQKKAGGPSQMPRETMPEIPASVMRDPD